MLRTCLSSKGIQLKLLRSVLLVIVLLPGMALAKPLARRLVPADGGRGFCRFDLRKSFAA